MQTTDEKYIETALRFSRLSDDDNRQVGAVIVKDDRVISTDYNSFPFGVERKQGRDKQAWTVHAEIKAISNAAYDGRPTEDSTLYTTYFPCATCAGAIITAGIIRVVAPLPDLNHHRWGQSWKTSIQMFREAGVAVCYRRIDG